MMPYHQKLALLRKLRLLTQLQLAQASGVCLKTMQRYENGIKLPDKIKHNKLLEVLEISQQEFDFFDLAKIFEHIKANTAAEVKNLQSDIELLYIAKLENEIVALKEKNRELEQVLNAHIASQRTMNRDE